jgi:lipopolysaccharide transport system ATP-binding protein
MSSDTLVIVENVNKKFCRGLKRSLWYGVKDMGAELIGRNNNRDQLRQDEFWAVKDVSFDLKRGETLGLIGHNGAGKTTMLRMLNGLIKPDAGRLEIRGRMQALIALGAGFNPILTGRENVYINAAVLGIPKAEVDRRYDEIVAFAGIEEFMDMPVQSYSSGMRVRLGFSVAAYMNPDILLVDEVLSVGDLTFRAKSRQRIQELMENGVAIILVSHNLHTISYICSRTIVFEKGHIIYSGETERAIDIYRASVIKHQGVEITRAGTGEIKITKFEILDEADMPQVEFNMGSLVKLRLYYQAQEPIQNPVINIAIYGQGGNQITGLRNDADNTQLGTLFDSGYIDIVIPNFNLLPNIYILTVTIFHAEGYAFYDRIEGLAQLKVSGGHRVNGDVYVPHSWYLSQTSNKSELLMEAQ